MVRNRAAPEAKWLPRKTKLTRCAGQRGSGEAWERESRKEVQICHLFPTCGVFPYIRQLSSSSWVSLTSDTIDPEMASHPAG